MKIEIGGLAGETPPREGYVQVDAFGQPDVLARLEAMPFRAVEEIYASHVLEHLPNASIVPALREMRRCLAEDGRVELWVPDLIWHMRRFLNEADYATRWGLHLEFLFGSQEHEGQYHRTGFTPRRLADCLFMAGYREVKTRRAKRPERRRGDWYPMEVVAEARL